MSERYVLSSAFVLTGRNIQNLRIEYGQTVITPGNNTVGRKVGVESIIFHPNFEIDTLRHDISILKTNALMNIDDLFEPFSVLATPNSRFLSGTLAAHAGKLEYFKKMQKLI